MPIPNRILISPLNWGLGHATRCIPLVNAFLARDFEVFLASDGRAYQLLQKEFPDLQIFEIPGYNITYKTNNMMFNMAAQLPKIISAIYKEHKAVEKLVKEHDINILLSDNRYGCYSSLAKNIFLTHQFNIKIPLKPFEMMISYLNQKMIDRFDACWIPDFEGSTNLAGSLSQGVQSDKVHYIGALSRMTKLKAKKRYDIIVVLSGPEPQRSMLEKKILEQAKLLPEKFLLVKGETESDFVKQTDGNVEIVSYLTTKELNKSIMRSDLLISRSGYTTVMDLLYLEKKAILIPTPGQTEQEYLAKRLFKKKLFYAQKQDEINLKEAIKEAKKYNGFDESKYPKQNLEKVIDSLLLEMTE